jgi:hypothetical protein
LGLIVLPLPPAKIPCAVQLNNNNKKKKKKKKKKLVAAG